MRLAININSGGFDKASKNIAQVKDWTYRLDSKADYIDVNLGLDFCEYMDSLQLYPNLRDSLLLYLATECYCAGINYWQEKSDYKTSELFHLQALEIRKLVLGEHSAECATSLYELASLYSDNGEYTKAEEYYLKALNIREKVLGLYHPDYAESLSGLGWLYIERGNYQLAKEYNFQALDIRKKCLGDQHPDYAKSLDYIGTLFYTLGDFALAESYYLQAYEIRKRVLGENNIDYATSLNNLGVLYADMDNYSQAENFQLQALKINKKIKGEKHIDNAIPLHNLGWVYYNEFKYSEAEKCFVKALDIYRTNIGEEHPTYATLLNSLGILYSTQKNYTKAEECYKKTLEIYKRLLGEDHPYNAIPLRALGRLYQDKLEYPQAEEYYLRALNIRNNAVGTTDSYSAHTLYDLGVMYFKEDNYAKADSCFRQSLNIFKSLFLRSVGHLNEKERFEYYRGMQWMFEQMIPCFTYNYHISKPECSTLIYDNELFRKGVLLHSSETIKYSVLESGDSILIGMWNELHEKQNELNILEEREPFAVEKHLAVQEQANLLEKQITLNSATYRKHSTETQITWEGIRNELTTNQLAIEYFVVPMNDDSIIYCALLLRHESNYPVLVRLFEEKDILPLTTVATNGKFDPNSVYSYTKNGKELSKIIWNKLLPYIKQGETIYFAPSGLLHQLAIEALPFDSLHTMADMFNLVRLSSTCEIAIKKSNTCYTSATLYGGIQYNLKECEKDIKNDTIDRGILFFLKESELEVKDISELMRHNNIQARVLTAQQATEESFKALNGMRENIIHVATHGFYWTDSIASSKDYFVHTISKFDSSMSIDPLNRSGLLFAGAQLAMDGVSSPMGKENGVLTAKEISLMDLRDANLVVLSACNTGMGDITGEGVFGLQRAFKQAGAQTIVMSLWSVNDKATRLLMAEFYKNLLTYHQSKHEALTIAQRRMRQHPKYSSPYYWAGFIVID